MHTRTRTLITSGFAAAALAVSLASVPADAAGPAAGHPAAASAGTSVDTSSTTLPAARTADPAAATSAADVAGEGDDCGTTAVASAPTCLSIRAASTPSGTSTRAPAAAKPVGFSPAFLRSYYDIPAGTTHATVAIVDAGKYPNLEIDLARYRKNYKLPACTKANKCLRVVNEKGGSAPPSYYSYGWVGETALDVDMVSAICPTCHILVVQTAGPSHLYAGVQRAVAMGAKFVSMSWGAPTTSSAPRYDSYFKKTGVAFVASAGDNGYQSLYPAASPYVTAVGGTSLKKGSNGKYTETVWHNSAAQHGHATGAGCAPYEGKPAWQVGVVAGSVCANRAATDVSMVADPYTGVSIFVSCGNQSKCSGWEQYGGTSASAPMITALYALAGTPRGGSVPAWYPYAHRTTTTNRTDIKTGNDNINHNCHSARMCIAQTGWDGPTGLGTPKGLGMFKVPAASRITLHKAAHFFNFVGDAITVRYAPTNSSKLPLSYSISGIPYGLRFDATSQSLVGTITKSGTYTTKTTVRDANGGVQTTTFVWTIGYHHLIPNVQPLQATGSFKPYQYVTANYTAATFRVDKATGPAATNYLLKFQWYVNGQPIPGATLHAYQIPPKYENNYISVGVTATKPYWYGWQATSAQTKVTG